MECRTDDLLWNADDYETQRAQMTRPPLLLAVFTFGGEDEMGDKTLEETGVGGGVKERRALAPGVYSVSDNSCRENVVTVSV